MTAPPLAEVLAAVRATGATAAEVYRKRGRSRRWATGVSGPLAVTAQEAGWAVRAGSRSGSFFAAGSGDTPPLGAWPEPDGPALHLPPAIDGAEWDEPADLEVPLLGENEGFALLAGIERALAGELPGATLVEGVLEEGASEAELLSSRDVAAKSRHRGTALRVTASHGTGRAQLFQLARDARSLRPAAIGRRLADLVALDGCGRAAPDRERGDVVLDGAVAATLLAGILPLLLGRGAERRIAALADRGARIGASLLTLVDDGRLASGPLAAAVDGEGTPTRRVVLIDSGSFVRPLLPWWEAMNHSGSRAAVAGCVRRPGWRDLPRVGPSHFHLAPDPRRRVGELVESVNRGAYLVAPLGAARVDPEADRLAVPVTGYLLQRGAAATPFREALLTGGLRAFLHGIAAVARDMSWVPDSGGLVGSPSLLVGGLELRGA